MNIDNIEKGMKLKRHLEDYKHLTEKVALGQDYNGKIMARMEYRDSVEGYQKSVLIRLSQIESDVVRHMVIGRLREEIEKTKAELEAL